MIKYSDIHFFLLQRGTFKDKEEASQEVTGIDSIIKWDYMGAAEYEFGALPASLKRMTFMARNKELSPVPIQLHGESFVIYMSKNSPYVPKDIASVLDTLAEKEYSQNSYRVKMGFGFRNYTDGATITRLKKGCLKKTETVPNFSFVNLWWDIENDLLVFPNKDEYKQKIALAFEKLIERNYDGQKESVFQKIVGLFGTKVAD